MGLPKPDAAKCEDNIAKVLQTVSAFILMVDADGLKGINDKFGHATGTAYLTEIWDRLHSTFPKTFWHRYGGDEFYGVIASSKANEADLLARANRVKGMANIHGRDILVACSIGLYAAGKGESAIAAMAMADHAMYQVKKQHHGGVKAFTSDKCLALMSKWPEAWITVPISEGWRVLIYDDNTSPSAIPPVDLIVAKKTLPVTNGTIWVPENDDIRGLIEKLQEFSPAGLLEAPNPEGSDLFWDDATEEPEGASTIEVKEVNSCDPPPTELFTDWAETTEEKGPAVTEHEVIENAVIDHQEQTTGQDFIPWRSVKPAVWENGTPEEVPIIMEDPLIKTGVVKDVPITPKTKKKKVKPSRQLNPPDALKTSAENIKLKVTSVLSSVEMPRIEMPRITMKEFRVSEWIPKSLPRRPNEEDSQGPVRSVSPQNPLPEGLTKDLLGKVLWIWGMEPGLGVTYLADHAARTLSESLPVLLLDGNLERPAIIQKYPCEGPGWEASWLGKMPGKHPANVITEGNLRVWVLKQPVGPFRNLQKMWEVALFHLKSPEVTLVVDGGEQIPPPGTDFNILMLHGAFPERTADGNTILVSRQWMQGTILYDGSRTGLFNILKQCQELI